MNTFPSAEALEHTLGDPHLPNGPLTYAAAMAGDRAERRPHASLDRLRGWGYPAFLVPAALGGRLTSLEELLALARVVARRDPTAALIATSPWMAGVPVWQAGTPAQQRAYADAALRGQWSALSLREPGSSEPQESVTDTLTACRADGGYRLEGTATMVSDVRMARFACLQAREPETGAHTMLLTDLEQLPTAGYELLPRVSTHGVRGADVAGIRFHGAFVPASAVLGRPGGGADLAGRSLATIRTVLPAFGLGALDTGLRCAFDFLRHQRVHRGRAIDLPPVRAELAAAYLDLRVAETVASTCSRLLQRLPAIAPVSSAVAKYLVPHLAEQRLRRLAGVLGPRYLLRQDHWSGIFDKLLRDARLFVLLHGAAHDMLGTLAAQLSCLDGPVADPRRADPAFLPVCVAPPYPSGLRALAVASGNDPVTAALDEVCTALRTNEPALAGAAALLQAEGARLRADAREPADPGTEQGQRAGERYARVFAALCLARRHLAGERTHWLAPALTAVLRPDTPLPAENVESLFLELAMEYAGRSALSLSRPA
ncbi:acyl-CoA dehydrogenase family protein [Nonomuraea endophytica]|uniref:acyl-CoA dehydrogenase family protein n=1 Tax=Nonomuraea endophytica TaxID=714136 RepID=UPI0037CCA615